MDNTLTIRLSNELKKELKKISRSEGKQVSDLVRESIKKYLSVYRFRKLRNSTLPFAEAQGLLTDEDIFKTIS